MSIALSPLQKFVLLKREEHLKKEQVSESAEDREEKLKTSKVQSVSSKISRAGDSPVDRGGDDLDGPAAPKRPEEHCSHPKHRRTVAYGSIVGTITVCKDCGRTIEGES